MVEKPSIKKEPPKSSAQEARSASLTENEIAEYQRLFKSEYSVELTKAQALEKGLRLVRLLRVVLEETAKVKNQKR